MKHIIVGTAGHIDHGKTALVRALTGIDTDRLKEEKQRGISIDLGFAHIQLTPSVRLGFVDVPGHEHFVRNMLAGVGGIDVVLLVIAANDGIKPQTREHFEICRLLHVKRGLIALTKADLVDQDWIDLVRLEAEEYFAGSFLEGASIIPVSVRTGEGLDDLKAALLDSAERVAGRDSRAPVRLPVDRAFSIRGFGTVVTGTLVSGSVSEGDQLVLFPEKREVRVRSLQTHGESAKKVSAGSRAALNIPDVDLAHVRRGMVLVAPETFVSTRTIDCEVEAVAGAPGIPHRGSIKLYAGAAEILCELRHFGGAPLLPPGASGFARIFLRDPAVLVPGDRFVLRQSSPALTIGGGRVIDSQPPRTRLSEAQPERLKILRGDELGPKLELLLNQSKAGESIDRLAIVLGTDSTTLRDAARKAKMIVFDPPGWIISRSWSDTKRSGLIRAVKKFHLENPLQPGIPRYLLKEEVMPAAPLFVVDALVESIPELSSEKGGIRHRTHRAALNLEEQLAREKMTTVFEGAGLTPPSIVEALRDSGVGEKPARFVLQLLIKEGVLVRINDDLVFHRSAIDRVCAMLQARPAEDFTVSIFKEWTGISRKYAVPLLEYLDRKRITVRSGDQRKRV